MRSDSERPLQDPISSSSGGAGGTAATVLLFVAAYLLALASNFIDASVRSYAIWLGLMLLTAALRRACG